VIQNIEIGVVFGS